SFVKAADGIRDRNVTGVQTCALPISNRGNNTDKVRRHRKDLIDQKLRDGKYYIHCLVFLYIFTTFSFYTAYSSRSAASISLNERSDERRVGKERRSGPTPGRGAAMRA